MNTWSLHLFKGGKESPISSFRKRESKTNIRTNPYSPLVFLFLAPSDYLFRQLELLEKA